MAVNDPLIYCLRLLKTRQRTVWELDQAMQRRDVSQENRQATLERLQATQLIDDRLFAQSWVRTRDRLAPRGKIVLRQELLQHGIAKELADEVLAERALAAASEQEGHPSELTLARELVRRRERQYSHLSTEVRTRRQMAMLQRRGFSYDVIKRILEA